MKLFALGTIFLLITASCSFMEAYGGKSHFTETDLAFAGTRSDAGTRLLSHEPIRIDSNADFPSVANGGGNGSRDDPWVIERYSISGLSTSCCVYIGNTTDWFVLRDCHLSDAVGRYWNPYFYSCAITLFRVSSGRLENNTCDGSLKGIFLRFSTQITLTNNTVVSNNDGIFLDSSPGNTMMANRVLSNENNGITVDGSNDNLIASNEVAANDLNGIDITSSTGVSVMDNTVSSNKDCGIALTVASGNTIESNFLDSNGGVALWIYASTFAVVRGNTMLNGSIFLQGSFLPGLESYYDSHSIDETNTVNGRPVRYLKMQNGSTVQEGAGQVILVRCRGVTVSGQDLSHASVSVLLAYSDGNIIDGNDASHDTLAGIYLFSSDGNVIIRNDASSGMGAGIYLRYSDYNEVEANVVSENLLKGVGLENSGHNLIISNSITDNPAYGIEVSGARYNNITMNEIAGNYEGLYIHSEKNNITRNLFSANQHIGLVLYSGAGNQIHHNDFVVNHMQAYCLSEGNSWNDAYPSGGNYWSDYEGPDERIGPGQNISGSDGIGDTAYSISVGASDAYPLKARIDILPPSADAGLDQTRTQGSVVTFDGSASRDDVGISLYTWSFACDGVPQLLHGVSPSFLFSEVGEYLVMLLVEDASGKNDTDTMTVTILDSIPPVADAGADMCVGIRTLVTFDGSESADNIAVSNFTWSFLYDSSMRTLFGETPSFLFEQAGEYAVHLVVADTDGNSNGDDMLLVVFSHQIVLDAGWNLVSIPTSEMNWSISSVIAKNPEIEVIQAWDQECGWLQWARDAPDFLNTLGSLDSSRGYWVFNGRSGECIVNLFGAEPVGSSITLQAGWSLVGYPTLSEGASFADGLAGIPWDVVEQSDPSRPYNLLAMPGDAPMAPGRGYWVHVTEGCEWTPP